MTAINNLKGYGAKQTEGEIIYREVIDDLEFVVVMSYNKFYDGANKAHHQNSTQLSIECCVAPKGFQIHQSTNGISYFFQAKDGEEIIEGEGKFRELKTKKTKAGLLMREKDFCYYEVEEYIDNEGNTNFLIDRGNLQGMKKTGRKKIFRDVVWIIEVPKKDLLKLVC